MMMTHGCRDGGGETQPLRVKLDPGSKTTGVAVVRESESVDPETGEVERVEHVLWLGEIEHRGQAIRKALERRRNFRRSRRYRKTRFRAPRFQNRTRPEGWLPPSLQHRVETTTSWVARLRRLAPISALSQELIRFDTQAMENPEISGVAYQQGILAGYELREYLLEKWNRTCAYCGKTEVPLQIEHIVARSKGGSNRPYPDAGQDQRGHLTPRLPSAATRRRLWLCVPTQTTKGGSERGGLTALRAVRYPSPA
jgi:5-methylcytosine-specific restriction endonuclease McrA